MYASASIFNQMMGTLSDPWVMNEGDGTFQKSIMVSYDDSTSVSINSLRRPYLSSNASAQKGYVFAKLDKSLKTGIGAKVSTSLSGDLLTVTTEHVVSSEVIYILRLTPYRS